MWWIWRGRNKMDDLKSRSNFQVFWVNVCDDILVCYWIGVFLSEAFSICTLLWRSSSFFLTGLSSCFSWIIDQWSNGKDQVTCLISVVYEAQTCLCLIYKMLDNLILYGLLLCRVHLVSILECVFCCAKGLHFSLISVLMKMTACVLELGFLE